MTGQRSSDPSRHRGGRAERGSTAPLIAVLVVVSALGVSAVGHLGDAALRRARVEAHADVAALASVAAGTDAAAAVMTASGAMLLDSITHPHGERTVTVELDGVRASASAAPRGELIEHDR